MPTRAPLLALLLTACPAKTTGPPPPPPMPEITEAPAHTTHVLPTASPRTVVDVDGVPTALLLDPTREVLRATPDGHEVLLEGVRGLAAHLSEDGIATLAWTDGADAAWVRQGSADPVALPAPCDTCQVTPMAVSPRGDTTWVGGWRVDTSQDPPYTHAWLASVAPTSVDSTEGDAATTTLMRHDIGIEATQSALTALDASDQVWVAGRTSDDPDPRASSGLWLGHQGADGIATVDVPGAYPLRSPISLLGAGDRAWLAVPSDDVRDQVLLHLYDTDLQSQAVIELQLPVPRARRTGVHLELQGDTLALHVLLEADEPAVLTLHRGLDGAAIGQTFTPVGSDLQPLGVRGRDDGSYLIWGRRITLDGRETVVRELPAAE